MKNNIFNIRKLESKGKANLILYSILPVYSIFYILMKHDYVVDFIFVGITIFLGVLNFYKIIKFKKEGGLLFFQNIILFVYLISGDIENKKLLYFFTYFQVFFIVSFFISKLVFERKQNTKFEKKMFYTFLILCFVFILLFISNKFSPFIENISEKNETSFIYSFIILVILFIYSIPYFLIPILYFLFKRTDKDRDLYRTIEYQIEKENKIKKLKELNNSNIRFYIHRIRNNFTPLQALIMELLFENSVEAVKNSETKKISIYFSENNNNLIVKFCDTGVGISKQMERKMFQYGFSTKESGTGIGLGQVKDNLNALSGEIKYEGSENEYKTVFKLTIPNKKK